MNSFTIDRQHPSLPGHFPNSPIVPGVVILDHVIKLAQQQHNVAVKGIKKSKFVQILKAEEKVLVEYTDIKNNHLRFKCRKQQDQSLIAEGNLILEAR